MTHILRSLLILAAFSLGMAAHAQPPQPPPPAKYKVTLRYYIAAPRDEHVMQYDAMIEHMKGLKFEFDPKLDTHADTDREDRSKNYLRGSIASAKALKLLEPTVVQSILLVPAEFPLPEEADKPVMVRLELAGSLRADRQRELSNQTRVLLRELGFKEPVGYDHHGYSRRPQTRIVGTIPRSKLDLLQRDLRNHPAGWLSPIIPREELPSPFREANPVRVIEVLPDGEAVKEVPDPEPRGAEPYEKISADLWELVKDGKSGQSRVQVGFVGELSPDDAGWRLILEKAAPGFFIEGQLGQFVTGAIPFDQVKPLALSPMVSVIRLPRVSQVNVDPGTKIKGDNAKALEQSKVKELHERGYRGKGVRVAIIDRDFRGWEGLVKQKLLPAKTRLVDLTFVAGAEKPYYEVDPAPYSGDAKEFGHGTLCAQATALAAPEAELVLIRAEVGDPYELYEIARYTQGGRYSPRIEQRYNRLLTGTIDLQARRAKLLEERKPILNDFTDETDLEENFGFLGPFFGWIYSNRQWHRQRMADQETAEKKHREREETFRNRLKEISSLDGIPIVVNALSWNSGYPLGAVSPLSKALDDPKGPLWFQAVGNTRGQSWFGPYRSTPGDPAMKFADDDTKLPKGRWSNEVNFLAWQPYEGAAKPGLPEKARLRLTLQWREPHEPDYYLGNEDIYRTPLANLRLQLLRQRDPEAKSLPGDSFDLVARTLGRPERIEHLPGGSVYEQVLEVLLEKVGRYAIRVEKQVSSVWLFVPDLERKTPRFHELKNLTPTGIRPLGFDVEKYVTEVKQKGLMARPTGVPTLSALEKHWEFKPRVFVEVIDDTHRVQGRALLADFSTDTGSISLPADARNVISVGAASLKNLPQPYSAFGSPPGMELANRPWLYAYDELALAGGAAFGTSIANAFAAGTVAAMLSGSLTREQVVQILRGQEGQVLRVPTGRK